MIWILYAVLSNGEAGPVPVPADICLRVTSSLEAGSLVSVDLDDGSRTEIVAASCLGPASANPCEMEGTS